jgi:choline dehydrogenase-like flavoprotein
MFLNALSIEDKSIIDADICIIGAGCAGITLATELINSPLKVVLLESGGLEYDDKTQSLYEGENISFNPFKLENTRLRFFGGSTNHWGGMCHPLEKNDFLPRQELAYPGWPIELDALTPYYQRAQSLCQLGPFVYDDENYWRQHAGFKPLLTQADKLKTSFFQFSPPTRFGEVYKDVLERSRAVDVILNATALELEATADANHVSRVRVTSFSNKTFFVKARKFVVAAGGLETPRLLLLSNTVQKKGLGNKYDLLGRYYMDHPGLWSGTVQFITDQSSHPWYFNLRNKAEGLADMGAAFTPTESFLKNEGLLNFRLLLKPTPEEKSVDSIKYIAHEMAAAQLPEDLGVHIKNILSDIRPVANIALKTIFNSSANFIAAPPASNNGITKANIELGLEQFPNRDSRVSLSAQKDAFGQNRIKLDWRLSGIEQKTAKKAVETFALECGKHHLGRVHISDEVMEQNKNISCQISSHHMGTTKMAISPAEGVVDVNCKVHGVDNLFVASSSVFPTSGWANPTLTITALSIRLAEHLKSISRT